MWEDLNSNGEEVNFLPDGGASWFGCGGNNESSSRLVISLTLAHTYSGELGQIRHGMKLLPPNWSLLIKLKLRWAWRNYAILIGKLQQHVPRGPKKIRLYHVQTARSSPST